MMGSLKSSVAQLESEKDLLSRQVADLKSENRRVQNELSALEEKNGELAARLDDARNLISRQASGDSSGDSRSAIDLERPAPRRAIPARAQPRSRAAPFAQIPTERRPLDDPEAEDDFDLPPPRARRAPSDDQSRVEDRSPWTPIANKGLRPGGGRY